MGEQGKKPKLLSEIKYPKMDAILAKKRSPNFREQFNIQKLLVFIK